MRFIRTLAAMFATAALLAACGTSGPQLTQDLGGLRSAIAATRTHARTTFTSADALARQEGISRKLALAEVTLAESDFPVPVAAADAAAWDRAFGILDAYATGLQTLVAPDAAKATSDALGGLATELNTGAFKAGIPASLTGVFSTFAGALVQAKAERTATEVMRKTDSAFQGVVGRMAAAIGASPADPSTLQFTAYANLRTLTAQLQGDYAGLTPAQKSERTKVINDYVAALDTRDAQMLNLTQLHDALLALGAAHAAAAQGHPGEAGFWIQRISSWADDAKARTAAAAKAAGASK